MNKRTVIASVAAFAIGALTACALIFARPTTQAEVPSKSQAAVTDKSALLKSGFYHGMSIDQGTMKIRIDTEKKEFALLFTQSFDSLCYSGWYTVSGDRLIANCCTFRIEDDGSLVLLEAESSYFEKKPSPFFAEFEDGTVFSFSRALEPDMNFGF